MKVSTVGLVSFLSIWNLSVYVAADHYDTLGVSKKATDKEIKKAFRRLAAKLHPDKNPNNPEEAEKKFVKIAEAYEVLQDPQKRAQYDRFGDAAFKNGGNGGSHHGNFNMNDFFSGFDEAFANFRSGNKQRHKKAKSHFGFNFDDLFEDDFHSDFGHFDSFFGPSGGNENSEGFGDLYDNLNLQFSQGNRGGRRGANFMNADFQASSFSSSHSKTQRCKTITTRSGNSVSTQTICT